MCISMCACVNECKPEEDVGCSALSLSAFSPETASFTACKGRLQSSRPQWHCCLELTQLLNSLPVHNYGQVFNVGSGIQTQASIFALKLIFPTEAPLCHFLGSISSLSPFHLSISALFVHFEMNKFLCNMILLLCSFEQLYGIKCPWTIPLKLWAKINVY